MLTRRRLEQPVGCRNSVTDWAFVGAGRVMDEKPETLRLRELHGEVARLLGNPGAVRGAKTAFAPLDQVDCRPNRGLAPHTPQPLARAGRGRPSSDALRRG